MASKNLLVTIILITVACCGAYYNLSLVPDSSKCPAFETTTDLISNIMDSFTLYSIKPSVLLDLASQNETLRNLLTKEKFPDGITLIDYLICNSIDKLSKKCVYEKSTMLLLKEPWPYLEGGWSEVSPPICDIGYGDSGCNSYKYMTSTCGNITSIESKPAEENKYQRINKECEWIISVSVGYAIELTFTYFRNQECFESCECDHLKIYDILNNTDIERGKFCGAYSKWTFISHSNKIRLLYKLQGYDMGTGFSAVYRAVSHKRVKILGKVEHIYGLNGTVELKKSQPTQQIGDQQIYEWIIRTEEARVIQLHWNLMNTCNSGVKIVIFDGPGDNNAVLENITTTAAISGSTKCSGFQIYMQITKYRSCGTDFLARFLGQLGQDSFKVFKVTENNTFYSLNISGDDPKVFSFNENRSLTNVFEGVVFKVPENRYVSLNVAKFNFEGSNKDNCAEEGLVIWDGLPDKGTKYGPYCGNLISQWLFSGPFRRKRQITSEQTVIIHSSSNVLSVLFYQYSSSNAKPAEIQIVAEVSNCVGITNDWSHIQNSFLNVRHRSYRFNMFGINMTYRYITIIPAPDSCFVLQTLPTNLPMHEHTKVTIKQNGTFNRLTNFIKSDPDLPGCAGYILYTTFKYPTIMITRRMNCSVSPLGLVMKISNKEIRKSVCMTEIIVGKPDESTSRNYVDAVCGSLVYQNPTKYKIHFSGTSQHHHYLFKFGKTVYDPETFRCNIIEKSLYYSLEIPILTIKYQPFYWKTFWSFKVQMIIEIDYDYWFTPIEMDFQLVPDNYPLPYPEVLCPQNHTSRLYGYKEHCYEAVTFKKADKLTWKEAKKQCTDKGGTLLTIHNKNELEFIKGLFKHHLGCGIKVWYLGLITNGKEHQWVDGDPVVFTDWYKSPPEKILDLPKRFFGDELKFADTSLTQPVRDRSAPCTAMVFNTPSMSTNWIKIPCQFSFDKAGYICKYKGTANKDTTVETVKNKTTVLSKGNTTILQVGTVTSCPYKWLYFKDKCYRLISSTKAINVPFPCSYATKLCTGYGGNLATITQSALPEFEHLILGIWKHKSSYGGIWVSDCNIIIANDFPKGLEFLPNSTGSILNVLCMIHPSEKILECKQGQLECQDGTCISNHHICDGKRDCLLGDDELNCQCSDSDFLCEDGSCISMSNYCDFVADCGDNSDENNCSHSTCSSGKKQCDNGQCLASQKFNDQIADCLDASDENEKSSDVICNSFTCYSGECIPEDYVNNLRPDCEGNAQEDEVFTETKVFRGTWWYKKVNMGPYCPKHNGEDVRCHEYSSHCLPRHMACVYDADKYGYMAGCSDGSHLVGCENFECPGLFKCPQSYCIPLHKVCDGVIDCSGGADENECQALSCPGLFRCKEGYCIDQSMVCDGIYHCKDFHEDELFCNILCPPGCTCIGRSINCSFQGYAKIPLFSLETRSLILPGNKIRLDNSTLLPYKYLGLLNLDNNKIKFLPKYVFRHLINLLTLKLRYNRIEYLTSGMFHGLNSLQHLLLLGNPIKTLNPAAFEGLLSIQYLFLADLEIKTIEDKAFAELPTIKQLSLENNFIQNLNSSVFSGASGLKILNLKGNAISNIEVQTFSALELEELNMDDFKFCCFAKEVPLCTPSGDAFSSCDDLMANEFLQIAIWVLGFSALIGNIFVIIWRTAKQRTKTNSFLIINLGISDLLMGVYLIIIASADQYYRGKYILFADSWKSSHLCKFAGFLSTLSSQMSVYTLVVITSDRLLNIVFPTAGWKLSIKRASIVCCIGWLCFTILAFIPVVNISYFGEHFVKHGVCLLFNVSAGKTSGWEYITFLFLLFNLISFLFIFVSYIVMYCSINKTRQRANRKISKAEIEMTKRFVLIVITDFICWVPLIFTAFLALGGTPVMPQVTTWMAVFILPINSAINPYLYTVSAIGKMRKRANN